MDAANTSLLQALALSKTNAQPKHFQGLYKTHTLQLRCRHPGAREVHTCNTGNRMIPEAARCKSRDARGLAAAVHIVKGSQRTPEQIRGSQGGCSRSLRFTSAALWPGEGCNGPSPEMSDSDGTEMPSSPCGNTRVCGRTARVFEW